MNKLLSKYRGKSCKQVGGDVISKEVSILGYRRDSPYKDEDFLYIETPQGMITMKGVDIPLLGISNRNEVKVMYPGKEYQFKGDIVKEIPLRSLIRTTKFSNSGFRKRKFLSGGSIDGMSAQDYLDKRNKENNLISSATTGAATVGSTIANAILPGSGFIVGGAIKLIGAGANLVNTLMHKKNIDKAKRTLASNQLISVGQDYENKMKDALGYV